LAGLLEDLDDAVRARSARRAPTSSLQGEKSPLP
jgi:hypothetical protein